MRASVLFEQGKPLQVEEVDLEAPRSGRGARPHGGERRLSLAVCTPPTAPGRACPCPSCWATRAPAWWRRWAPGSTDLQVGDHVILSWAPTCGRCHYCVIGRPNLCERRMPGRGVLPDGTSRMALRGRTVYQYGHVATYASSTVVHESCAIRIDPACRSIAPPSSAAR